MYKKYYNFFTGLKIEGVFNFNAAVVECDTRECIYKYSEQNCRC